MHISTGPVSVVQHLANCIWVQAWSKNVKRPWYKGIEQLLCKWHYAAVCDQIFTNAHNFRDETYTSLVQRPGHQPSCRRNHLELPSESCKYRKIWSTNSGRIDQLPNFLKTTWDTPLLSVQEWGQWGIRAELFHHSVLGLFLLRFKSCNNHSRVVTISNKI